MSPHLVKAVLGILASGVVSLSSSVANGQGVGTAPWVGTTFDGAACSGGSQGFGPFDYTQRVQYQHELKLVEDYHFTPNVENLISGASSTDIMSDINYTLRAWPNHHRALNSLIRTSLRGDNGGLRSKYPDTECYLQRAINYSPGDGVAIMLYGIYLHRMDKKDQALEAYQSAEQRDPGNLQIQYNTGLLLVDLERYEEAAVYGKRVYAQEFPLPGLRRKLEENGYWEKTTP